MAHESCKSQIAVLEMNGHSVPQRWTSMREGSNTARRQCSTWDVELSAIRRAKVLASRESGYRVAHSRQVLRCHPTETLEHLDADSEMDAISDIQPVQNVSVSTIPGALSALEALCDYALYKSTFTLQNVTPNVRQTSVMLASVRHQT